MREAGHQPHGRQYGQSQSEDGKDGVRPVLAEEQSGSHDRDHRGERENDRSCPGGRHALQGRHLGKKSDGAQGGKGGQRETSSHEVWRCSQELGEDTGSAIRYPGNKTKQARISDISQQKVHADCQESGKELAENRGSRRGLRAGWDRATENEDAGHDYRRGRGGIEP